MKKQTLALLVELASRHRDNAAQLSSSAQSASARAADTLSGLEQYRQTHQDGRDRAAQALPGAVGLAIHNRFSGKLDEAIDAQRSQCAQLEQNLDRRASELVSAQARLQALKALEQRRLLAQRRRAQSVEQRLLDEHNANTHMRKATKR